MKKNYLMADDFYGYTAKDAYSKGCSTVGFDPDCIGHFGRQKLLYAANATSEGYSVWFIANSNWTGSQGGAWVNTIAGDYSWITEQYINAEPDVNDCRLRLVFAKNPHRSNGYVFLGVYEPISWDANTRTRKYTRRADRYSSTFTTLNMAA